MVEVGIDSFTAPDIANRCRNVLQASIDTCEAARFTVMVRTIHKCFVNIINIS
jgi:hypothetical protein